MIKRRHLISFSISKYRHKNFKEVLLWFVHNFILGLRFNELFRNETRYLFFYLFYSPLELDWNRKNCSNAEQKSHCRAHNYQRALVYNFGRKCKASFGSNYHKDHNTKGSFKIEAENRRNRPIKNTKNLWRNPLFYLGK